MSASAAHAAHRQLLHDLLYWRRGALGLEELVELPPDRRDPSQEECVALEAILALGPGFLAEVRRVDGPWRGQDAFAAVAAHDAASPPPDETVPVCARCVRPAASLLRRHGLPFRLAPMAPGRNRLCLCEGTTTDGAPLLFRLALEAAGRPRTLVIGGNAAIDAALRQVKRARVHVVRDDHRLDPSVVADLDLVVMARGLVVHKTTNPYTAALRALPEAARPVVVHPRQPNANTVALAIVEERDRIRSGARRGGR